MQPDLFLGPSHTMSSTAPVPALAVLSSTPQVGAMAGGQVSGSDRHLHHQQVQAGVLTCPGALTSSCCKTHQEHSQQLHDLLTARAQPPGPERTLWALGWLPALQACQPAAVCPLPFTGNTGSRTCHPGPQVATHGFRLKRSLNPDMLASLFFNFSAISFSFVQVICTLSGVGGARVLAATTEWDAVFRS